MATSSTLAKYKNFIGGEWVEARSGKAIENRNPANTDELVGIFPASNQEDVNAAVAAAKRAYKTVAPHAPAQARRNFVPRRRNAHPERKDDLARDMTREMGKVLEETRGDVQEAIDMTFYMAGEGRRLFGQTTTSELPNKFCMTVRTPLGVAGSSRRGISPWRFLRGRSCRRSICGNTVVLISRPRTRRSPPATWCGADGSRRAARRGEHRVRDGPGAECGSLFMHHDDVRADLLHWLDGSRPKVVSKPARPHSRSAASKWAARTSSW